MLERKFILLSWGFLAKAKDLSEQPFIWGTATASYQVEGARSTDGRQPSIWDAYDTPGVSDVISSTKPSGECNVLNCDDGSVCDNDYIQFQDSVDLTSAYGFSSARLSIAMPRVMTFSLDSATNELSWTPNEQGLAHYKTVLQAYAAKGISVALTMFHWDLPVAIEEKAAADSCEGSGGGGSAWLCWDLMTQVFADYADLLLDNFADDVAFWITINEPLTIVSNGYASRNHAPGRCSDRSECFHGDSSTEPYLAAKGLLLAHATAFSAWDKRGRPGTGCGMTLNGDWRVAFEPSSEDDQAAAVRALEWQVALFADPIHFGAWPQSMVDAVGERLDPLGWAWTEAQASLVNNTHDGFFFMNTYTSMYARASEDGGCGFFCDAAVETSGYDFDTGEPIGTPSSNGWLFNYGPGIGELMAWYNDRYPGLSYVVTENGWGNATAPSMDDDLADTERCSFYRDYIGNMSSYAAEHDMDVAAYFAWSLMDNYEWSDGFTTRFGLTYVDYDTLERTPKLSAAWLAQVVAPLEALPTDGQPLPPCDESLLSRFKKGKKKGRRHHHKGLQKTGPSVE